MASTVNNNKDWKTNKILFVQGKLFVKFEINTPNILNSRLANSMHTQYTITIMMAVQNLNDSLSFRSLWRYVATNNR